MDTKEIIEKHRINFKSGVPEILFKKVNGNCSVPRCKKPTTGPFIENSELAVNMGVACHIYSAAENGPRGRGGKDEAFISSEENGIWCCQYHASLIDKKNGVDYPAPTLLAWKQLAEARILKKMNDAPSPLGWVDSIEFFSIAPSANGRMQREKPKLSLSRYTLITGENGVGKTAFLEAAAAVCNSRYFERISSSYTREGNTKKGIRIEAKITYTTVDAFSQELSVIADNYVIRRKLGGTPCLLPPGDVEVIFISEDDQRKKHEDDDISFLTRALNVDSSALQELIDIGPSMIMEGRLHFRDEMVEDEFENLRHRVDDYENQLTELVLTRKTLQGKDFEVTYNGLSGSEKTRLLIALSITKAREVAKQKLTLLLIENLAINFDKGNFEHLLRTLRDEDFQVLVSIPPCRENDITDKSTGPQKLRDLDYLEGWKLEVI